MITIKIIIIIIIIIIICNIFPFAGNKIISDLSRNQWHEHLLTGQAY
jgi:hypothetical protein